MLTVLELSADGRRVVAEGRTVFEGGAKHPTIEGPKLYKRDGWYWIFAPAGGVPKGWQVALRARSVYGPYEVRIVLAQGRTAVNGPHQGGWVEALDGSDWFLHFQDRGAYGRVVHLQPMRWKDGWPVMGDNPDGDGTGEPVASGRVPVPGQARQVPQTSDELDGPSLGLQWQWQSDPQASWWSFDRGSLHLSAVPAAASGATLWAAGHLLLQKLPAPSFVATTRARPEALREGEGRADRRTVHRPRGDVDRGEGRHLRPRTPRGGPSRFGALRLVPRRSIGSPRGAGSALRRAAAARPPAARRPHLRPAG